ncbi:Hypothetical predicted protein, partial [Mytilus galloprovincialis]
MGRSRHRQTNNREYEVYYIKSSPIIKLSWEGADIVKPITVTIPCPPNPAKARKIAQMRKMKEDKMKQARPVIVTYDEEQEKKRLLEEKKKKYQQQQEEAMNELEEKKFVQTKWYMGDYAHTDDDENDLLYLLTQSSNGKWSVLENIHIHQIKLDLLQFDMTKPLDSFMVLRTRMNTPDDTVALMANIISEFLSQRFAQVLVKQRSDDPYDTLISVVPANKAVKTSKEMAAKGYIEGPDPSPVINLNEGDHIEIAFRGNICDTTNRPPLFVYNSNIISELEVYLSEVDKYLQKNFRVYRGKIQIYRCYCDVKEKKAKRQMSVSDDIGQTAITEKIKQHLCDIPINIPKYNLESSPVPVKAPVTIVNDSDPINENLMRYLAVEMGEEWRRLAQILNVSRARMQAILRNIQISDGTEEDARYEMLMSWLKKMPKAVDKVSTLNGALMRCGRDDLTEEIQKRCLVLASILGQQYVRAGKQIIDQHEDVDNVKYCGILCYQCDLLPHQRDCDRIVECGSNEECYGSRLISDDGLTKFRSGCRDKSVCTVRAPIFGKRAELIPCSQCCNTSYCNLETCDNHITSNSKRCLSCKYALTPEDCNLSIQCNTDEVCYTQAIIHNQEKRYRLGCAHKNQCAARFDPVSGGVGRRAASDYCGQCCDGSNCNRELCTGKNIPHSKLTMPPPLSFCRDNSSSACAAHVNECSQDYYKYYQCPYTCKTCGAGPI